MKNIAIVGAGIGGLTAALVLRKAGYRVMVLERGAKAAPVGTEEITATYRRHRAQRLVSHLQGQQVELTAGAAIPSVLATPQNRG